MFLPFAVLPGTLQQALQGFIDLVWMGMHAYHNAILIYTSPCGSRDCVCVVPVAAATLYVVRDMQGLE
jgi:hypothetical protein